MRFPAFYALAVSAAVAAHLAGHTGPEDLEELFASSLSEADDACGNGEECSLKLLQLKGLSKSAAVAAEARSKVPVLDHPVPARRKSVPLDQQPLGSDGRVELTPAHEAGSDRVKQLAGKSIYFVVVDRFARVDGNNTRCNDKRHWCGGTLKGLTSRLDYISEMGFEVLWITPVIQQYEGETKDGTGFMGYWAKNLYKIDPHYGTPQDLIDLVEGLHQRGMQLMMDFVVNHMGPIHSGKDVQDLYPFNDTDYFHTLNRGDLSFDEYVDPDRVSTDGVATPAQAMWSKSGAQCPVGANCNCYSCEKPKANQFYMPMPSWDACPFGRMVWNSSSPCPEGTLSAFCMPGDALCKDYNETVTLDGWFYDLGDLNQSVPFVRRELLKWVTWMVQTYNIDMLRLDTASFVPIDFLSELQDAAGVPIIGEVTSTNLSYHASFQEFQGKAVLDGVLNFPLYYTAVAAFCHTWFPYATGNLTFLGERIVEQQAAGLYSNVDALGNFIDNHDVNRLSSECKSDVSRMTNSIAWTMLTKGTPIIYYGTETFSKSWRVSFWQTNYTTVTPAYHYFAALNKLRKAYSLNDSPIEVFTSTSPQKLVFKRGSFIYEQVWVYLNNYESSDSVIKYCSALPPPAPKDFHWMHYIWGNPATFDEQGCVLAETNLPIILVLGRKDTVYHNWFTDAVIPTPPPQENPYAKRRTG
ncbi:unnamed protein product [Polarella glacialis]|uniref:Glycosyl hydrolase family 13 catalytic domain-containing protein n=1 Tax=Polarella glacialis TaxID=89957 RepID=A0A813K2E7_POLGL|nr:unnamed protein product [Polarella glacialis]